MEYTRDRLHRTLRSFGRYELTTAYTPAWQCKASTNSLLSDRDYTWNDNGELIRIEQPAPDPELQLQHHRQADRRSHHRSEP